MSQITKLLASSFLLLLILTACVSANAEPEQVVEAYLNAIVDAKVDKISTLSCLEWEEQAWLELDSFQGVEVSLVDMQCSQSGSDGETVLVTCSGHFLTCRLTWTPANMNWLNREGIGWYAVIAKSMAQTLDA